MPEYNVHHTGYVSHVETVEADSPEQAIELSEVGNVSLCHQCTREWDSAGDVEVFAVTDSSGEYVWEQEPAPQPLVVDREALPTADRIAQALFERDHEALGSAQTWREVGPRSKATYLSRADAVLALLTASAK